MPYRKDDIQLMFTHEEVRAVSCDRCDMIKGSYCGIRGQRMRKQFCHIERFKKYRKYINTPMYDTKKFE